MKTKKIHHSWLILLVALGIMGGLVGVLLNCTGIIFAEIIKEFGFKQGDLSIYYTIRSLTRAAALGFLSNLFFNKNSKKVLIGMTAITCLAYMSMGLYTQLWQWYVSAFIIGAGTSYTGMAISVLLANWFHAKKGFVMGLAMSSSGLFGAVVSPLCSTIIEASGWRTACVVMGIITFVTVALPGALFLVLTPEEIGEKPYGYGTTEQKSEKELKTVNYHIPFYIFPVCIVVICVVCLAGKILNQLPLYADSLGYAVNTGAMLTSFAMIGNVVGKLATGWLSDRIGVFRALQLTFATVLVSLIMFMAFKQSESLLYVASLLFGTIFAVDANIPPLLFMDVWGKGYEKQLKNFQTVSFTLSAFSSSLLPYIYDYTQSYDVLFVLGIGFTVISFVALVWLKAWLNRKNLMI